MPHKHFSMLISILLSITILLACAKPSEGVIRQSFTDTQLQLTKAQSKSTESMTVDSEQIQAPTAVNTNLAATSHTTSLNLNLGRLPLYFVENGGQTDSNVAFYVLGGNTQVYFTSNGVTFVLMEPGVTGAELTPSGTFPGYSAAARSGFFVRAGLSTNNSPDTSLSSSLPKRWAVKLDFVGANPVRPIGAGETVATVSYFTGKSDQWHSGLSTYTQIVYRDLWTGIDLVYYGQAGKLNYDFLVHPGADPNQIQLRYRGTEGVSLNPAGQMMVSTPVGGFIDEAPVAWQATNGERTPVEATYELISGSLAENDQTLSTSREHGRTAEGMTFGFAVGRYDRTQSLVIDPAVLVYCGYIGGLSRDEGTKIAVDGAGNAYITGGTLSAEDSFPVTVGPDSTYNGGWDAFVAKVSPSGNALVYAGYIGGSLEDYGFGIAVDGDSNAYITGKTWSSQDSFPVTGGPDLIYNGDSDAFVAKVSASGETLVYAGYIGGVLGDEGYNIAVDGNGNAFISGVTASTETTFPVKGGPDLTFNGTTDAFVAKVSASGESLDYAGYIGGSGWEWGYSIALDSADNAYIAGTTSSSEASFPVLIGPDLTFNGIAGSYDAFVAVVSASGETLIYAGYIGGSGEDKGWGIAVDKAGNAYITGETASTQDSFPVMLGPDLTFNGGEKDAFVAKVSVGGAGLVYAGYIGGVGGDFGYDIAVDDIGNVFVVGFTYSDQTTFPVTLGPLSTYNGGARDAFVVKVSDTGAKMIYAGFIGGSGTDYGIGIAVDGAGNAFISGSTNSDQATFPVMGGPDLTYNGGEYDAFIAKVVLVPWTVFLPLTVNGE